MFNWLEQSRRVLIFGEDVIGLRTMVYRELVASTEYNIMAHEFNSDRESGVGAEESGKKQTSIESTGTC